MTNPRPHLLLILPLVQAHTDSRHEDQIDTRRAIHVIGLPIRNYLPEVHKVARDCSYGLPVQIDLRGSIEPISLQRECNWLFICRVHEADLALAAHKAEFACHFEQLLPAGRDAKEGFIECEQLVLQME